MKQTIVRICLFLSSQIFSQRVSTITHVYYNDSQITKKERKNHTQQLTITVFFLYFKTTQNMQLNSIKNSH